MKKQIVGLTQLSLFGLEVNINVQRYNIWRRTQPRHIDYPLLMEADVFTTTGERRDVGGQPQTRITWSGRETQKVYAAWVPDEYIHDGRRDMTIVDDMVAKAHHRGVVHVGDALEAKYARYLAEMWNNPLRIVIGA